ncbi:hypothetical protein C0993_001602, partial [Termitomyces sp. T159_Od127]
MPTGLTTDVAYPRICLAKLNAHWLATEPLFDWTTGDFTKWSNQSEIFLQQSGLDCYVFAPQRKPELLIAEPKL